jgi:hypothetical protein
MILNLSKNEKRKKIPIILGRLRCGPWPKPYRRGGTAPAHRPHRSFPSPLSLALNMHARSQAFYGDVALSPSHAHSHPTLAPVMWGSGLPRRALKTPLAQFTSRTLAQVHNPETLAIASWFGHRRPLLVLPLAGVALPRTSPSIAAASTPSCSLTRTCTRLTLAMRLEFTGTASAPPATLRRRLRPQLQSLELLVAYFLPIAGDLVISLQTLYNIIVAPQHVFSNAILAIDMYLGLFFAG